jgi:hypothetical protein
MTTITGRQRKGECDPNSWREWYDSNGDGNHPRSPLDMPVEMLKLFDGRNVDHPYCFIREAQLRVSRELPGLGGGLVAAAGGLKSFELRDAAGAWHPAVTLYNNEGLPATPFQYLPVELQSLQRNK